LAFQFDAILLGDFAVTAATFVFEPFTFKSITICVVHDSTRLSPVVLHVTIVELAVGEEDFNEAIRKLPTFETTFNDLIWWAEKDTLALWAAFTPLTLVYGAVGELTDA